MKLTPHELAEKGGITDDALVKQMINDPDAFEATIRQLFDIELIQQCKDLNIKINANMNRAEKRKAIATARRKLHK